MLAGRVEPPLEVDALDHHRARHRPVRSPVVLRADVDDDRAVPHLDREVVGLDAVDGRSDSGEQPLDGAVVSHGGRSGARRVRSVGGRSRAPRRAPGRCDRPAVRARRRSSPRGRGSTRGCWSPAPGRWPRCRARGRAAARPPRRSGGVRGRYRPATSVISTRSPCTTTRAPAEAPWSCELHPLTGGPADHPGLPAIGGDQPHGSALGLVVVGVGPPQVLGGRQALRDVEQEREGERRVDRLEVVDGGGNDGHRVPPGASGGRGWTLSGPNRRRGGGGGSAFLVNPDWIGQI